MPSFIITVCFITFGPSVMHRFDPVLVDGPAQCAKIAVEQLANFSSVKTFTLPKDKRDLDFFCGPALEKCADHRSKP